MEIINRIIPLEESSINAKKRNVKNVIDTLTKGKSGYNNVRTFGIITSENPNCEPLSTKENGKLMKELKKIFKNSRHIWVQQLGKFGGNQEHSIFIFNISLINLIYYAGKYEQTSFFFGEIVKENGAQNLKISYYQKRVDGQPYDKYKNPYDLIETTTNILDLSNEDVDEYSIVGKHFKYTIPLKYFNTVEDNLTENLNKFFNGGGERDIVNLSINGVGWHVLHVQSRLNYGITEKLNKIN